MVAQKVSVGDSFCIHESIETEQMRLIKLAPQGGA